MIDFEFIDVEIPGFDSEFFVLSMNELIKSENYEMGEITVVFCKDEYLLDMNRTYLNHDYYTDIITFDYSKDKIISGDLLYLLIGLSKTLVLFMYLLITS